MNNEAPVRSKVLLSIKRGPTSGVTVTLDQWPDKKSTVKIESWRPSVKGDIRRSVTLYPLELKEIAVSLALAHRELGLPS